MSNPGETPIENPTPVATDPAEAFVVEELTKARGSLMRTRIFSVLIPVALGAYLIYVTNVFKANLRPDNAAQVASTVIQQRVEDGAPQFASYLKEKVPEYIREVPDYAIRQLPIYREQLEDRLETELQGHARQSSDQLVKELDTFLTEHKDDINTLLKEGDNPALADEMGKALEKHFVAYLEGNAVNGESIKDKIDHSLEALKRVETKTRHLAANKGLKPTEKKARRAIAIMLATIERASEGGDPHVKLPKVSMDPEQGVNVQP